ncbi:MAG TPA: RagB/SusD family nutrient uptake outer membrane protein [Chitinophagaceae bacterium]|nr:RagB/SusD family nutrient uptake outer membrane protein [Chitinophagaceae bacterium]
MKTIKIYIGLITVLIGISIADSCTNLTPKVYSAVLNSNFWQTPAQVAAGVGPAYQSLTAIPNGNTFDLVEQTSDEQISPTRGGDWYDNDQWQQMWLHTWTPTHAIINGAWGDIYSGIGKVNFILKVVNSLPTPPPTLPAINAELKTIRDYYYYLALDLWGNVPLVIDFNTNPDSVTNTPRAQVYAFVVNELKTNLDNLPQNVDGTTYGRVTQWMAWTLLAKLYLNAGVFTGTPDWADCISACDSVMNSGKYSLQPDYFDNFSPTNQTSVENIFVVPFDKTNIGGDNWEMETLHYQSQGTFNLSGQPWNGFSTTADFYNLFDTNSVYTAKGGNLYRTFLDQRTGQYLIGQQFNTQYAYPPSTNVLVYSADPSLKLTDIQTQKLLVFTPVINYISDPADTFRLAGVRNIKYFPEAGTSGNQDNDMVIFRYADILLMKAECEMRLGTNLSDALGLVNQVRERAYGGDVSHDWTMADLTFPNLLAERGREFAWELCRRQDLIRFGNGLFEAARTPDKTQDPDNHTELFPIPAQQISSNPNLKQNPGY